jgi:DNA/RNA endonuclease G (NUC1)
MSDREARVWGTVLVAALFLSATGSKPSEPPRFRPAILTKYKQAFTITAAQQQLLDRHCFQGMPVHSKTAPLGPTRLIVRDGYALEHSSELRIPLWVCEHLAKEDVDDPTDRLSPEPFAPDPLLARFGRAELRDFSHSGFARGHMSPDANRESDELKKQTYFLSNMVPQAGNRFNSTVWLRLEEAARQWAIKFGECWIITGSCIYDPQEESESTADGLAEFQTIGPEHVGVPTHLFKIIVRKGADGKPVALAFVMPNKSYESGTQFADFLVSIDSVEDRTGFDFFPKLPAADAAALEKNAATELWPQH